MKKNKKLEFYVLNYDWNNKKVVNYNVLNETIVESLLESIKKKKITNINELREALTVEFRYYYWSKRECEISVGDLFEKDLDKYEKVCVYDQLEPNIPVIANYIVDELGIDFQNKTELKKRVSEVTLTSYNFTKEKNFIIEDLLNIIDHQQEEIKELQNIGGERDQ